MNELRRVAYPDPHRSRTRALLRAHPEIKGLLGPTWWTPPVAAILVTAHVGLAALASALPWWAAPLLAFGVGAFLAQALYAVLHECAHLLAGRGRTFNRALSLAANLPLLAPIAISYAHFHLMHHRHQGDPARDPDLPGAIEHGLARGGHVGKLLWQAGFPIWQLLRTRGMPGPRARGWLVANALVQVAFTIGVALWLGPSAVVYLALSLYFTMALHPIAARLVQEHHVVREGQETYSYHGALNAIALNVGYHHEHHDFPAVPWTRLPALRRIAREVYDEELASHRSWLRLWWRFFTDETLGPLSRVVRPLRTEDPPATSARRPSAASARNSSPLSRSTCGDPAAPLAPATPR